MLIILKIEFFVETQFTKKYIKKGRRICLIKQ